MKIFTDKDQNYELLYFEMQTMHFTIKTLNIRVVIRNVKYAIVYSSTGGGGHNMSQSTFLNMERAAEFNNSVPKNINKFLQNVVN